MNSIQIMKTVASWHGITWDQFCSPTKFREVVTARHEAWFLCTLHSRESFVSIGNKCGFSNTSISEAVRNYKGPDRSEFLLSGETPPRRTVFRSKWNYNRRFYAKLRTNPELYQAHLDKMRAYTRNRIRA